MIAETICLITDLQMPELNGLELQEALRAEADRSIFERAGALFLVPNRSTKDR